MRAVDDGLTASYCTLGEKVSRVRGQNGGSIYLASQDRCRPRSIYRLQQ